MWVRARLIRALHKIIYEQMARVLHITTIWLCGVKTFAGVEVREADVGEVPLGMVDGENFVEVWSRKINKKLHPK